MPVSSCEQLAVQYAQFQKQHGSRAGIEDVILNKRRAELEQQLDTEPYNYDLWFDYCNLEEQSQSSSPNRVNMVYERACANTPPTTESKQFWKRYIFLYLNWAANAELHNSHDPLQIYQEILKKIPHQQFTFTKVWIQLAQFHLRKGDLTAARKTYGQAIGKCPRKSIFNAYVAMEMQLVEIDRCRKILEKQLELFR